MCAIQEKGGGEGVVIALTVIALVIRGVAILRLVIGGGKSLLLQLGDAVNVQVDQVSNATSSTSGNFLERGKRRNSLCRSITNEKDQDSTVSTPYNCNPVKFPDIETAVEIYNTIAAHYRPSKSTKLTHTITSPVPSSWLPCIPLHL